MLIPRNIAKDTTPPKIVVTAIGPERKVVGPELLPRADGDPAVVHFQAPGRRKEVEVFRTDVRPARAVFDKPVKLADDATRWRGTPRCTGAARPRERTPSSCAPATRPATSAPRPGAAALRVRPPAARPRRHHGPLPARPVADRPDEGARHGRRRGGLGRRALHLAAAPHRRSRDPQPRQRQPLADRALRTRPAASRGSTSSRCARARAGPPPPSS